MAVRILRSIAGMPEIWFFETREDAGRMLAEEVARYAGNAQAIVLGIPRGGVPVGAPIALRLGAPLDVIIPRKIPIPWEPEAGFGAVTADGTIVLNDEYVPLLGLSREEIVQAAREVQEEIRRRTRVYRDDRPPPAVQGRLVVLTDDGLATGFTMLAAIRSLRASNPSRVLVAVPAAPRSSLDRVAAEADDAICLILQERSPFAVASFYHRFPDLDDEEVIAYLRQAERLQT